MKLLLFSDVHCSKPAVQRLIDAAANADVLVGAGDFGVMRRGTAETLTPFQHAERPLVLVPGNAESMEELRAAANWPGAHPLHASQTEIDGVVFFGFGGGVPVTPFGAWSYDFSEEEAVAGLANLPYESVLVVHSPPHGCADRSSRGLHLGSTAIREAILRTRPRLVVCGHIHESGGTVDTLEGTPVVNAGPEGILWDLDANQRLAPQRG